MKIKEHIISEYVVNVLSKQIYLCHVIKTPVRRESTTGYDRLRPPYDWKSQVVGDRSHD